VNPELITRPCLHAVFANTPVDEWIEKVAASMAAEAGSNNFF
jgi:hypothetical protein